MTREEAIRILDPETTGEALSEIEYYNGFSGKKAAAQAVSDACVLAVAALREQEELEDVWHDAKDSPPQKPGVYYGKVDDTNSMFACLYRDGVWTLNAYPETRMCITEWAYYDAFVREQEERENRKGADFDAVNNWIPVTERLPENEKDVLIRAERKLYGIGKSGSKIASVISMAFHTDGKMNTEQSAYTWETEYLDAEYDEEADAYIIPEGWWESVTYSEAFSAVCDVVTHWMPLPEPPKEDA